MYRRDTDAVPARYPRGTNAGPTRSSHGIFEVVVGPRRVVRCVCVCVRSFVSARVRVK